MLEKRIVRRDQYSGEVLDDGGIGPLRFEEVSEPLAGEKIEQDSQKGENDEK